MKCNHEEYSNDITFENLKRLFLKKYKEHKEFVFKYFSFRCVKVRGKKKFTLMSKFSPQNCVFYRMEIRRAMLKQPIRTEYLIKQKPRGALAQQVNDFV